MSWVSSFGRKVNKTVDRFLDKQIGIDDPGIRTGIIIAGSALAGYSATTVAGIGVGATLGAVTGAGLALAGGRQAASAAFITPAVKPPSSFGGDVLNAQERLRKRLALQMSTSKTNVTSGIRGISSTVRPTLMTL